MELKPKLLNLQGRIEFLAKDYHPQQLLQIEYATSRTTQSKTIIPTTNGSYNNNTLYNNKIGKPI